MDYLHSLGKSIARRDFLKILNEFAQGTLRPILVTDHGKAQAVILPFAEYQAMKIKLGNYEQTQRKEKRGSIWGDSITLNTDLEKHNWDDIHNDWLAKWEDTL